MPSVYLEHSIAAYIFIHFLFFIYIHNTILDQPKTIPMNLLSRNHQTYYIFLLYPRRVAANPAVTPAVAPATKASAAATVNGATNGAKKNILFNLLKINHISNIITKRYS